MKKSNIIRAILVVLIAATLLAAYSLNKKALNKTSQLPNEKVWTVDILSLKKGKYTPNQLLFGEVESTHKASLTASIKSDVTQVTIKEGQTVNKAQTLIQLDPRHYQLLVDEKIAEVKALVALKKSEQVKFKANKDSLIHDKSLVELNKKILQRFEYLNKRKLGATSQVDDANKLLIQQLLSLQQRKQAIENHDNKLLEVQAKINIAKAQLGRAKLELEDAIIKAPFEGKITSVNVSVGNHVSLNTPLVSLYNLDEVYLRAQIPHRLLSILFNALKNKQDIYAVPQKNPLIKLKLDRLASEVDTGDANIDAFFTVPKKYAALVPLGTSVAVLINLPAVQAYKIPRTALYGHNKIYIIQNHRLKSIKVDRLGKIESNSSLDLLITSPELKPGDRLLVTKLPNARGGLKVIQAQEF